MPVNFLLTALSQGQARLPTKASSSTSFEFIALSPLWKLVSSFSFIRNYEPNAHRRRDRREDQLLRDPRNSNLYVHFFHHCLLLRVWQDRSKWPYDPIDLYCSHSLLALYTNTPAVGGHLATLLSHFNDLNHSIANIRVVQGNYSLT